MNKQKIALLAALLSLSILTGCGDKTEVIEVNGEQFIKNGDDYTKIEEKKQVFEPGTHFVQYYNFVSNGNSKYNYDLDSGINTTTNIPVYDGYEIYAVYPFLHNGYTYGYTYIFINTKKVEVTSTYDVEHNIYAFSKPGVVVEEHILG